MNMSNLPAKTNVIYGVGQAANYKQKQDKSYYVQTALDLKQLYSLKNKFKLHKLNYEILKDVALKRELDVIDYSQVLLGLISQLIQRNCLTFTKSRTKLNRLGEHLQKIRNLVDFTQATETGSLSQFYSAKDTLANSIEGVLFNYYSSLELEPLISPKAKHEIITTSLGLDNNWEALNQELINNLTTFSKEAKQLFIVEDNFNSLKLKFTLTLLSPNEFDYYLLLSNEQALTKDLTEVFYNVLKFDLLGSTTRFYTALLIEALYSSYIYINSLPEDIKYYPWRLFLSTNNYLEEKRQLANYMNLAVEISYLFYKFYIFDEMKDLFNCFYKDYLELTQYIYNMEVSSDYTLKDYYV